MEAGSRWEVGGLGGEEGGELRSVCKIMKKMLFNKIKRLSGFISLS